LAVTIQDKDEHEADGAEREIARHVRTCVGCRKTDDPSALVRIVLGPRAPGGQAPVAVDFAGGSHGRGAHVHPRPACLALAAKGGLSRSFKTNVAASADELAAQIVEGADRRIAGLLAGAWRARLVQHGADATTAALDAGAPLVVVAKDAKGVVERGAVGRAIAEGRAVAWKDKAALGALLGGRDEVAVCAVCDESVAREIARARAMADEAGASDARADSEASGRGTACRSREAR
jgi:predicted RNA-binding protein YlxR (DUF448 family)